MQTQAPGPGSEVLSKVPEERPRGQTEFQRIELPVVLCQHPTQQAAEGGRVPGKEDRKRCLEKEAWVRTTSTLPALRLTHLL
jgi:hypothetical protein